VRIGQFVAGINTALIRVVLPKEFDKSRQQELCGAMSKHNAHLTGFTATSAQRTPRSLLA
jgi:hypothetical protein